jgi:hypothetical protein
MIKAYRGTTRAATDRRRDDYWDTETTVDLRQVAAVAPDHNPEADPPGAVRVLIGGAWIGLCVDYGAFLADWHKAVARGW